jgi:hypothetical protein
MARHLFIAQQTLDTWVDQDKVEFDHNVMTIKADGRSFKMVEAVRFVKVEGGEEDAAGLLGRVKTNDQLKAMGAERYRDSVLYQDIAYKVQEGFIGEVFLKEKPAAEEEPVKPEVVKPSAQQRAPRPDAHARTQPHLPATKKPAAPKPAVPAKPQEKKKKTDEELSDEEMLVNFLLNNL